MKQQSLLIAIMAGLALAVMACAPEDTLGQRVEALIYGADNRHETYEYHPTSWIRRVASQSVVAIGYRDHLVAPAMSDAASAPRPVTIDAPSAREAASLCPEERFGDQPAFALCTGVALGPDLVLTAAHCLHLAPLDRLVAVNGYQYLAEGELAPITTLGVRDIIEAVAIDDGLDYAWLRLGPGNALSAVEQFADAPAPGTPVVGINHGLGLPAKVDDGGKAFAPDGESFLTNIDSYGGASGGPVFDGAGRLYGILTAGSPDFLPTQQGCLVSRHDADGPLSANEVVLAVDVAFPALCTADPTATPCGRPAMGGCSVAGAAARPLPPDKAALVLVPGLVACRRRRRRGNLAQLSTPQAPAPK